MKKSTALALLMGLLFSPPVSYARTRKAAPPPAASAPTSSAPTPSAPSPSASEPGQEEGKKAKADDFVTLNFTNIDISALAKVMSELTRRNFLLDEKVSGKVTLMTPTKMSPEEAYQVFLTALESKGFTALQEGTITRIIPVGAVRQSGVKVIEDEKTSMSGQGYVTKLIRLTYVNPQEIARTITPLITRDGTIIPYAPTNSIIITDQVHNIRRIESLLRAMDVPAPEGKGKINVYYLKNANAEEIAKLMAGIVSKIPTTPPGGVQQASVTSILEGPVSVNADKATNSLIIVASPGDFEVVKDVIQKLDIRRRQVYVEAAIVEMSLAKQRELGFEFQAATLGNVANSNNITTIGGTNFGNIAAASTGPAGLATLNGLNVGAVKGTFTYNGVQYLNIGALLHALQTDGDVNVLSTPNILTMDNQKAEIMVGENVPFITGQTQNAATGAGAILNSIDRKDVGIKLQITPQIASDDNVRLEIKQEISDVIQSTGAQSSLGPTTSKRSADTTVVIKDRQTMVIGGLIRDNLVTTTSKVPLLGDIPILGWLFKFKSTRIEKTNLMIFITPYIIKNEDEGGELTKWKNKSIEQFRQEYHMEKKGDVVPPPSSLMPQSAPTQTLPAEKTGSIKTPEGAAALPSAPTGTFPATAPQTGPTGTMGLKAAGTEVKSAASATGEGNGPGAAPQSAPTGTAVQKGAEPVSTPSLTTNQAQGSGHKQGGGKAKKTKKGANLQSGPTTTVPNREKPADWWTAPTGSTGSRSSSNWWLSSPSATLEKGSAGTGVSSAPAGTASAAPAGGMQ